MKSTHIFLYWGPRKESLPYLVKRCISHFAALEQAGDPFSNWYKLGSSRKHALSRANVSIHNYENVEQLLIAGQSKTDVSPRIIIKELGYSVNLWNGDAGGFQANTSIRCGAHSLALSEDAQNVVSFEATAKRSIDFDVKSLFATLRDIWDPTSANIWETTDGVERVIISI